MMEKKASKLTPSEYRIVSLIQEYVQQTTNRTLAQAAENFPVCPETDLARQLYVHLLHLHGLSEHFIKILLKSKLSVVKQLFVNSQTSSRSRELLEIILSRMAGHYAEEDEEQQLKNLRDSLNVLLQRVDCARTRNDLDNFVFGLLTHFVKRYDRLSALRGLYLVASDPNIRREIMRALCMSGLVAHVGLIALQARNAGYTLKTKEGNLTW